MKMKNNYQDGLFYWTQHAQEKLRQYNLSASRVKRVIRHANRIEAGIAPETWASMQAAGSKKHPYEIWTMYVIENPKPRRIQGHAPHVVHGSKPKTIKIISAWKYPGTTNPGDPVPIPPDIFEELTKELGLS
ncbi:MAG: DUF4258 domain-containing protein [Minisyncoccia bacterium]